MQLRPREYFTIARGIEDPSDASTYYVRAVIRNARTDALLDTVNLTDQGNRRFTAPWQVPADTSGEGFYILITTTVYTDSGYTAKSGNYGETFTTYLVQDRPNPNLGIGGAGADIDYKRVRKIIQEELSPIASSVESIDLRSIISTIADVKQLIRELPTPPTVSLKPVLDGLANVLAAIKAIPAPPKPEPINLTPLLAELRGLITPLAEQIHGAAVEFSQVKADYADIATRGTKIVENVGKVFADDLATIKNSFDGLLKRSDLSSLGTPPPPEPQKKNYHL